MARRSARLHFRAPLLADLCPSSGDPSEWEGPLVTMRSPTGHFLRRRVKHPIGGLFARNRVRRRQASTQAGAAAKRLESATGRSPAKKSLWNLEVFLVVRDPGPDKAVWPAIPGLIAHPTAFAAHPNQCIPPQQLPTRPNPQQAAIPSVPPSPHILRRTTRPWHHRPH